MSGHAPRSTPDSTPDPSSPVSSPVHRTAGSVVTWLFVPGDRPQRFAKAAASGADGVILDLEDAVVPQAKTDAREHVAQWLTEGNPGWVRVNAPGTSWYDDDIAAISAGSGLCGIMVPKAEDPALLVELRARLPKPVQLVALVESALAVHRAVEVAGAVDRIAFGSIDYALDLGAQHSWEALLHARAALVLASRVAGIAAPIDGVTTALRDEKVLADDVAAARALGFTAKLCIHPAQVPLVARGFAPSGEEIAWARRVLEAVAAQDDGEHGPRGALTVDGAMVDKPVVDRARRILAVAQDQAKAPMQEETT